MKTLVIVTRIYATPGDIDIGSLSDEFCKYWGGKKDLPILNFIAATCKIIVINGPYFKSGNGAKPEWRNNIDEPSGDSYFTLIKPYLSNDDGEVGIIVHQPLNFHLDQIISSHRPQLLFSKEYTSIGNYYDLIYVLLAQSCRNNTIREVDLFEKLWREFAGDPILEAKLDLLHNCLTPKGIPEEFSDILKTDKNGNSTDYESKFNEFKQLVNGITDPFDEQKYIKPLEQLRNSLLAN